MDIQVAGHRIDCAAALNDVDAIAAHLVKAKAAPGHALCLCTAPARKLVIRTVGTRHFLAVWPHDGHLHHYACLFHRNEGARTEGGVAVNPAILETGDGFDIAADFALARKQHIEGAEPAARSLPSSLPTSTRPTRARMGLLGILQHLWQEAQLNRWGSGWKRDWWRVTNQLLPVLEQGTVARRPMVECVYLVPEFKEVRRQLIDGAWGSFRRRLERGGSDEVTMGIVVGEAKAFERSPHGFKLSLRHLRDPLFMSGALRDKLSVSYSRAFNQIGNDETIRVVCIALVELSKMNYVTVIDAALMATSRQYIPVDSSYEARLAHKLVDEDRSFSKPLKLEGDSQTLPDFILSDTWPPFVLEVFGMTTSDYLERKAQKLDLYRTEGKPVWSWNADKEPHPPRLPDPVRKFGAAP